MARYTATVPSKRSPDDSFAFVADFRNLPQWDPSMEEARLTDGRPTEVGSEYLIKMRVAGRTTELEYRTTESDPPSQAVLRSESSRFVSVDTITVRESDERVEVTYDADLELKGPLKLVDPLFSLVFKRLSSKARDGLERELGKPAGPSA